MKRRTPLKVDPEQVRDWVQRSRRRLPARSKKVEADLPRRAEVRARVLHPGAECHLSPRRMGLQANVRLVGLCFGPLTPHHVRKAGQGGAYDDDNLVPLCAFHNGLLEADADVAALGRSLGLVKRRGDA